MSDYETKRDQYIHDHQPDVTLALHYVFEAAENRIAELKAESKKYEEDLRLEQIAHTGTEERAERVEAALARKTEEYALRPGGYQDEYKLRCKGEAAMAELKTHPLRSVTRAPRRGGEWGVSALDDMREAIFAIHADDALFINDRGELDPLGADYIPEVSVIAAIDTFEAAHPGLRDRTKLCERCDLPFDTGLGVQIANRVVCPACAEAARGKKP